MRFDDESRLRLNAYAVDKGYTWKEVKDFVDIADFAIDQQIRKTFGLNGRVKLSEEFAGSDRLWITYEAERQVWRAIAPTHEGFPETEPKLPTWWAALRRKVRQEVLNVMSRTCSTGGNSKDGRLTSNQKDPASQTPSATIQDNQRFHCVYFPKHVLSFIYGSGGDQEYIRNVEKKFMCRIRGTQGRDYLQLWAQPWQKGGPAEGGVAACGVFLKSYEREIRYNSRRDKAGPRIDSFLDYYISDDFTTVEQRTGGEFDYLSRRALGVAFNITPDPVRNDPKLRSAEEPSSVTDQVTGEKMSLPRLLKVHEGRVKKTYKKELMAENSTFMKRIEATMRDKWCDEYGFETAPRSSAGDLPQTIREAAEEIPQVRAAISARSTTAENTEV